MWLLLLPAIAGLLAWLFSAPDVRYVTGITWTLAATAIIHTVALADTRQSLRNRILAMVAVLGLLPPIVMPTMRGLRRDVPFDPIAWVFRANFTRPHPTQ